MNENNTALAKVGIYALIDDLTGYKRAQGEYIKMFRAFTPDKEFADLIGFGFIKEVCRILDISINDFQSHSKKIHEFLLEILNREFHNQTPAQHIQSMTIVLKIANNLTHFNELLSTYKSNSTRYINDTK